MSAPAQVIGKAAQIEPEWGVCAPPYWDNKPVIVVGCGPSLKGFDLNRLNGLGYVLAVKAAIWDLPFADACVGIDRPWMQRDHARLEEVAQRIPLYLVLPKDDSTGREIRSKIPSATYLELRRVSNWLSEKPRWLECGSTSGFAAYNLAYLKKPRTIVLFGFDFTAGGHYNQHEYKHHIGDWNAQHWPSWAKHFTETLPQIERSGIQVINACATSSITAFPKMTPDEAVTYLEGKR